MRVLNLLCGISVLFATFAFGHIVYHLAVHSPQGAFHSPGFLAGFILSIPIGILSFIGACMLIRSAR